MNKLRTARILMTATILLILAFQVYWMRKLYQEEINNFKKSADLIFREAMYRLQAERFTGDTMVFKGLPRDNLFMTDVISTVEQVNTKGDSFKRNLVISMNTDDEGHNAPVQFYKGHGKDTVVTIDTKEAGLPPPGIERFLEHNKTINDTISIQRIDSMYTALLQKEGIDVEHRIIRTAPVKRDSTGGTLTLRMDVPRGKFSTKGVPVGFLSPSFYRAEFNDPTLHILKKISMQLVLSALLIALTTISFVFIYRSLLAQRRLTAIKNEFIGNITHELKTPIATVSVAIEAMKNFNALQSPERTKEYLGIAGQELNRLSLLVDKVLRLSMFEKQEVELKNEWFNVKDLVQEVMDSMQLQFQKFGAVVKLNTEGNDFSIMADRMHITSVVYNLLDNALKYSKDQPIVEVQITEKRNEMLLLFKDNGIGIPASYREKIFDKFFRVPQGDKHNVKGYGLGLSYVAHIINQHHGTIVMESEDGKGTTFIIKLPKEDASH